MNTKDIVRQIIEKVTSETVPLLVNPIDHSDAVGSEPVTDEVEVIDHTTGKVVKISDRIISLSEGNLRDLVKRMLLKTF